MKDYFRPNISRMKGYTPGMQPRGGGWTKLNTNENPYPPSPAVKAAIIEAAEDLRKYPDPAGNVFRKAAAEVFGVKLEQVLCGNGSDDILTLITRAFCGPDDVMAYPCPTYSLYPVLARIQDCKSVEVDFPDDYGLPMGLLETNAKVVILANPNAPTGTVIPLGDVAAFTSSLDGIVVVDEAYVDFADESAVRLVERHHNLIVSRSLSKSYSLAGLRFGFAVADAKLIDGLMKVKDSYNVDRLSIAAATAAIRDQAWMQANAGRIRRTRAALTARLRRMGFSVLPSQANFVLARSEDAKSARAIFRALKKRKILVRYFDHRRVDDCLRITIGTDEEVDRLVAALKDVLSGL